MSSRIGHWIRQIFTGSERPRNTRSFVAAEGRQETRGGSPLISPPLRAPEISVVALSEPVGQSQVINIFDIIDEGHLLECLRSGARVEVYRGRKKGAEAEQKERLTRTFVGLGRNERETYAERLVEEVRSTEFPNRLSRLHSVFATATQFDAQRFGEVYTIELSLLGGEGDTLPICWLDRDNFDEILRMGTGWRTQDGDILEADKNFARRYLNCSGELSGTADILIDPKQVEIKVTGKYVAKEINLAREFAINVVRNKCVLCFDDYSELVDKLDTEIRRFPQGVSHKLIRQMVLKLYVRETLQTTSDSDSCLADVVADLRRCLSENELYLDSNDCEYQYVSQRLSELEEIVRQGPGQ
ncbi:MAG: hypothetical protein ABIH69_04335 [bacterium]